MQLLTLNEKECNRVNRHPPGSTVPPQNTALRPGDSPERPVWRSKTASRNGKICVNDGVIKRPSCARMCVAVANAETGL